MDSKMLHSKYKHVPCRVSTPNSQVNKHRGSRNFQLPKTTDLSFPLQWTNKKPHTATIQTKKFQQETSIDLTKESKPTVSNSIIEERPLKCSLVTNNVAVENPVRKYAHTIVLPKIASNGGPKMVEFQDCAPLANDPMYNSDLKKSERFAVIPPTLDQIESETKMAAKVNAAMKLWDNSGDIKINKQIKNFMNLHQNYKCSKTLNDIIPKDLTGGHYSSVFYPSWYLELQRQQMDYLVQMQLQFVTQKDEKFKLWTPDEEDESKIPRYLVNWGIIPDVQAAKRRQKEKQDEERWQIETQSAYQKGMEAENIYKGKNRELYAMEYKTIEKCSKKLTPKRPIIKINKNYGQALPPKAKTNSTKIWRKEQQNKSNANSSGFYSGGSSCGSLSPSKQQLPTINQVQRLVSKNARISNQRQHCINTQSTPVHLAVNKRPFGVGHGQTYLPAY